MLQQDKKVLEYRPAHFEKNIHLAAYQKQRLASREISKCRYSVVLTYMTKSCQRTRASGFDKGREGLQSLAQV